MSGIEASPKKLSSLVKRLRAKFKPESGTPCGLCADPVISEVIYSLMLWNVDSSAAEAALARLREHVADANDLRVFPAEDLAELMPNADGRARDRAMRIRSVLGDIFGRRHALDLSHLPSAGKRETRSFIESLEGITPFAASRTLCRTLEIPSMPVDDRLACLLLEEGVLAEPCPCEHVTAWMDKQFAASEISETHLLFQAWSDKEGKSPVSAVPCEPDLGTTAPPKDPDKASRRSAGERSADKPAEKHAEKNGKAKTKPKVKRPARSAKEAKA